MQFDATRVQEIEIADYDSHDLNRSEEDTEKKQKRVNKKKRVQGRSVNASINSLPEDVQI